MVFQIIDEKQGCFGVYTNGQFIYDRIPSGLRRTWTWSDHLSSGDFDFAFLWAGGKSLSEVCPDSLRPRLEAHEKKIKSHIKSFVIRKGKVTNTQQYALKNYKDKYILETSKQITNWCQQQKKLVLETET